MIYKKILNTVIKVFLPLILGCALLWYLYRGFDFAQMWENIKSAHFSILLLSLVFGVTANVIRGIRWGILIDTLGERYKIKNLIFAVLGNYAINYVLPRAGEVWRCGIITKYEKISFTKLLGTLLIDRVADTVSVGLLTMFIFLFNFRFFETFFIKNPIDISDTSPILWILFALIIVAAAVWFTFTRLTHIGIVQKAKGVLSNVLKGVWEGMKSVWRMERKWLFLIQTFMIWGLYFLFFYTTFYAFDFTRNLGIGIGLIAFTMSSIGVAAPVQGGIGAWHFMVIFTLKQFGVSGSEAAAFALVVHTLQSVWQVLCGLFGIVALPIVNKEPKV